MYNYRIKFADGQIFKNDYSMTEEKALAAVSEIIAEQAKAGNSIVSVKIEKVA